MRFALARLVMRRALPLTLAALGVAATTFGDVREARACGGCFAPPVDNTAVAYHRMALSISTTETTLYDQLRYSGSPSSFAWVLPIRGEAKVGISADIVFQILDQNTTPYWSPPPMNCPSPPVCPSRYSNAPSAASDSAGSASMDAGTAGPPEVQVLKEETVGPYETVQLKSTSQSALTDWLTSRGYSIPDDIKPLIASYVSEGFDFLALKLVPGAGTQSMKPVRVTTTGAAPSLPLRMIAAGSGASVGVSLWVLGDGRWEPQSFPSFAVEASEVTWTWKTRTSDLAARRAQHVAALGPSAWEIETSADFSSYLITNVIQSYASSTMPPQGRLPDGGFGTIQLYDPVLDDQGHVVKSSAEVARDDMAALFQNKASLRVTRMHSDLPRASLATDLVLQAAAVQTELPIRRQITQEADEPLCPVYQGCTYVGEAPRSKAKAAATDSCGGVAADGTTSKFCGGSTGGGGCTVQAPAAPGDLAPWTFAALGLIGAGLSRRRRARG